VILGAHKVPFAELMKVPYLRSQSRRDRMCCSCSHYGTASELMIRLNTVAFLSCDQGFLQVIYVDRLSARTRDEATAFL
jgi:hypothetical protein